MTACIKLATNRFLSVAI